MPYGFFSVIFANNQPPGCAGLNTSTSVRVAHFPKSSSVANTGPRSRCGLDTDRALGSTAFCGVHSRQSQEASFIQRSNFSCRLQKLHLTNAHCLSYCRHADVSFLDIAMDKQYSVENEPREVRFILLRQRKVSSNIQYAHIEGESAGNNEANDLKASRS